MCRSIVQLRSPEPTEAEDIEAAARQFVRKVSGFHHPSKANTDVFEAAVAEIAEVTERLLGSLVVRGVQSNGPGSS